MASNTTITINGRAYDAKTGLPVADAPAPAKKSAPAPVPAPAAAPATPAKKPVVSASTKKPAASRGAVKAAASVHSTGPQRSQTLRRQAVKKPVAPAKVVKRQPAVRHMDIARSDRVAKFAPHPVAAKKSAEPRETPDTPVQPHPVAQRAVAKTAAKAQARQRAATAHAQPSAKALKEAQVQKALAPTPAAHKPTKPTKAAKAAKKTIKKNAPAPLWKKRTIILSGVAVVALLGVLAATHVFPALSVQLASMQSGVNAVYPKYIPDGYSLTRPITHKDGHVAMSFASNSNSTKYTLTQSASSWDSTAVLDNLVKKEAQNNYVTTRERGLTIYTYEKHAAWVNGGILYTINGTADLSGDQIRKIATSL